MNKDNLDSLKGPLVSVTVLVNLSIVRNDVDFDWCVHAHQYADKFIKII